MNFLKKTLLLAVFFVLFTINTADAVVPEVPERPYAYVMDLADIITPDVERTLNLYLGELERKTTAQIVILTLLSLEGESIEDFSIRLAEKWKVGQKGKDNGVIITVSLRDRKYRFEIGYGLEGALPDSFVGTLGRRYFVPYFRQGKFSEGIMRATIAIAERIANSEGVSLTLPQGVRVVHVQKKVGVLEVVGGLLFFIIAAWLFIKHPRLFLFILLLSGTGRRGGWYSGGGFGGGGFGGFGGGGGGGFGGGGASGGW
jgi:uncharacterized protein